MMSEPHWLAYLFATVMLALSAYNLMRLVIARTAGRPTHHDVDLSHAVMGLAMAGMLASGLRLLPNPAWAAIFAVATAWFTWRIGRIYLGRHRDRPATAARWQPHCLAHLAMCGAMVYMPLVMPAGPGAAATPGGAGGMAMGGGGGRFSVLALALAFIACGYAAWQADQLTRLPRTRVGDPRRAMAAVTTGSAGTGTSAVPLSPRLAACGQIAMAVTMAYMFVLMA